MSSKILPGEHQDSRPQNNQPIGSQELVELGLHYRAVPLADEGETLVLALSDLSDNRAIAAFRFATGKEIAVVHWENSRLQARLRELSAKPMLHELQQITVCSSSEGDRLRDEINIEGSRAEAPVIRFINHILLTAAERGASDIHFEPYAGHYRIRFRLDGVLHVISPSPPRGLACSIAVRLKIISGLNIAERRLPQDGRLTLAVSPTLKISLRVSTLPTRWGEKIVLRLLESQDLPLDIEKLAMPAYVLNCYIRSLEQPQGLVLITGPTGSGKSITLYSGLQKLNTPERNICAAEDPVEIAMEGVNQVQIDPRVGLTFAQALRAFLRQDPDVIMVGEIRDQETAEIALKAAQSGHMVLATLHTNSAAATLTRLLQLGVPCYQLASALRLVIAQRLVRRLCHSCRSPTNANPDDQRGAAVAGKGLYLAEGCEKCHGGFQGRIGIYEAMLVTQELAEAILHGADEHSLCQIARRQGMELLWESALELVERGVTSLPEIKRVLGSQT